MDRHIKNLGMLHIVYGFFFILSTQFIAAIAMRTGNLLGLLHGPAYSHSDIHSRGYEILNFIGYHATLSLFVLGLAGIIAGCALLSRKNWARITVMVLGIIALLNIPFGTALGIYTLWVTTKPETRQLTA